MSSANTSKKFASWKAIANYFSRSERTVRRWESTEGLPVHRHNHHGGARIFAFQTELDDWFASRKTASNAFPSMNTGNLRIAVLPFEILSDDADKIFLRDAVCEDMIADIADLQSFTVISYSSMRFLPEKPAEVIAALSAMALDYYIEGSIRIEANKIRLNVRLINANNLNIDWTARYNQELNSWDSLRKQIVAEVINSLPLSNATEAFSKQSKSTIENHTAWEYLHKARTESLKWQPATIERAIQFLQAASNLVGDNEIILASLGRAYLQQREAGIDHTSRPLEMAQQILDKLTSSQPSAFSTISLNAWYRYASGEVGDAIEFLRQALQLRPNDPDVLGLLYNCYLITGQNDLALPLIRRLQIVDPLTPLSRCAPGWYKLLTGDFAGAIGPYENMLAMDPNNPLARLFMAWVYALNNRQNDVEKTCDGFIKPLQDSLPARIAFAFCDKYQDSNFTLNLTPEEESLASINEMFARFIAFAYAASNSADKSITWLEKAHQLGFCAFPFMRDHDPYFRQFKQNDRFEKLMLSMDAKWRRYSQS